MQRNLQRTFTGMAMLILALVIGCSDQGNDPVTPVGADIVISATNHDFGYIVLNQTGSVIITITNNGDASATLSGVQSSDAAYTTDFTTSVSLAPSQTHNLNVIFSPTALQSYAGTLTVATSIDTFTVTLTGRSYRVWVDVAPIFSQHCTACHGGGAPQNGYGLDSYSKALTGGRIIPNDPDNSFTLQRIEGQTMPPGGGVAVVQSSVIREWIATGAREN